MSDPTPATLIVFGAPSARGPGWPAGLGRIVLCEPDADVARRALNGLDLPVQQIAALPGAQAGQARLTRYNFPGLRALRTPAPALHALLPGLRPRDTCPVDLRPVPDLLAQMGDLGAVIHLDVWLPGSEQDILGAWAEAGALWHVTQLRLRLSEQTLFNDSTDMAGMLLWLARRGFVPLSIQRDDPDWPVVVLRADSTLRAQMLASARLPELESEAAAQRQAAQSSKAAHQASQQALDQAHQAHAALQTELTALQQKHDALQAATKDHDQLRQQLHDSTIARDTAEAARAVAEARVVELTQSHDSQSRRIADLDGRLTLAQRELRRAEGQIDLVADLLLRGDAL